MNFDPVTNPNPTVEGNPETVLTPPQEELVPSTNPNPKNPDALPKPDDQNPMKQLRGQYEQTKSEKERMEKIVQSIAKQRNMKVEDLEKVLKDEEDKTIATQKNIPVEVQQQLRQHEEYIKQLQMDNLRKDFDIRQQGLMKEYPKLTQEDLLLFAEDAKKLGINIVTPGIDLVAVYRAVNYPKIQEDLKQTMKNDILAELQRQGMYGNQIGILPTKTGVTDTQPKDFMDKVFQSLIKK